CARSYINYAMDYW
nr:immunoglobulin heavy chain junction region [Mus musculus]